MPYVLSMLDCRHLKCMSLPAGCGLTLYFSHVFNPQVTPLAPKEAAARSLHNCKCGILAGSLTFLGEAWIIESTCMLRLKSNPSNANWVLSMPLLLQQQSSHPAASPITAVTSLCRPMTESTASVSRAHEASVNTLLGGAVASTLSDTLFCAPKANGHMCLCL